MGEGVSNMDLFTIEINCKMVLRKKPSSIRHTDNKSSIVTTTMLQAVTQCRMLQERAL